MVANFQDMYVKKHGRKSEVFAANAYDSTMLIAEAMKDCNTNTFCIKEFLYDLKDYSGVSRIHTFDEFGEVKKPLIIKMVKNGKFVPYN